MARVLSEGSGKGADTPHHTTLNVDDSGTVHLPDGIDATSFNMARDGQDLVLTAPNGETYVVENYFLNADAPVIVSGSGALLTPALVQSFLTSAGDVQVAAADAQNDGTPVGEVSEVTGNATVTHADGTKEAIASGTQIFEGDIIETDAHGAVNIKFADDSTFAVSENARMAVDDFSFNSSDQSGTTGISILRGVFMFTSGLIGRENPDAVHLETPVGSIGIRGTIIGGQIHEGGQTQISVLEGAIVVRNGTGEQILSNQFETVTLTGFNQAITNIGQLDAQHMTQSYGAVRPVSQSLFTSIDDTAHETQQSQPQQQQTQPQPETQPQTDAQPQQPAPLPSAVTDHTIFQTLSTGSNIESALGAAPDTTQTTTPTTTPGTTTTTTTPPANTAPTATTPVIEDKPPIDQRAPGAAAFTAGGLVAEESAAGTVVGTIGAAALFPVAYSLVTNPGNLFAINAQTGLITLVNRAGDYDTGTTHYDLTVRTTRTDTGSAASLFTDSNVTVGVTNVDEAPAFPGTGTTIGVDEGASIALTTTLAAADPEGGALTYTVTHESKGHIQVNGVDATSFTSADLAAGIVTYHHDGSEPGSGAASFTLVATDDTAHATADRVINVTVTNINDDPQLVVTAGGHIAENATKLIDGTMLNWSDSDSNPQDVVFTITSVSDGAVQKYNGSTWVNISTGQTFTMDDVAHDRIQFTQNGAEVSTVGFGYTVTDGIATAQTSALNFAVDGVNDAPVLSHNVGATINEDQAFVLTDSNLLFTDAENNTLTYNVTANAHGYVQITTDGGTTWNNSTTFTQADVTAGHVRFLQNGDEDTTAFFDYSLSDGAATPQTGTFTLNITNINDAATINTVPTLTFQERVGVGHPMVALTPLGINDAEPVDGSSPYSFVVQRYDSGTSSFVTDTRFDVVFDTGAWQLALKAGQGLDYEGEPNLTMRIQFTDGTNSTITTPSFNLTITDGNDPSTNFSLNGGDLYRDDATHSYAGLLQGRASGASAGVLLAQDVDSTPSYHPSANDFKIISVSGGGFDTNSFEVKALTHDNGSVEYVLKLKDGVSGNFALGGTEVNVTVKLDADQNGSIADAVDIQKTFTFLGRNDTLVLGALDGHNGFQLINDARFGGAKFGASVAVGDFDGDGATDFIIGATLASNGTAENSGGYYAFKGGSALKTDSANGDVALSHLTSTALPGSFLELTTIGNDAGRLYGSQIVTLRNFDKTAGADFAVTNPGEGKVEIHHSDQISIVTGIPTGSLNGDALAKAITIASIGDINGDGYTDLLVGSTQATVSSTTGAGMVGIVYGSASPSATYDFTTLPVQLHEVSATTGSGYGSAVTGLGDVNGDGLADFAVSAPHANSDKGLVYIYYGNTSSTALAAATPLKIIDSTTAANHLGTHLAAAGDFNGDGLNDFMLTSDATDSGRGSVTLVYGSAGLSIGNTPLSTLGRTEFHWSEADSTIHVGNSISRAGDFNGDGFDDIMLDVSKNLGSSYEHTLYIVYGSGGPQTSYNLDALTHTEGAFKIRLTDTTSDQLTLTSMGDYNGDGFDDIMIGDSSLNNNDGGASVVYGGNYDFKASQMTADVTTAAANTGYIGTAGNDTVTASAPNVSFHGGAGDDTFRINNAAAVRSFKGGAGSDTLSLFFSSEESTGAGTTDTIDLRGLGNKASGVEKIVFESGSENDVLTLNIQDIISMASSTGDHKLIISQLGSTAVGHENQLIINNATTNTAAGSLASLGFTKDVDSNGQDHITVNGQDHYVYTNAASGVELLVDTRIANAQTLAG